MDDLPAGNPKFRDLKCFYPSKKSPFTQPMAVSSVLDNKCDNNTEKTKSDETIETIDLSDDSLIEDGDLNLAGIHEQKGCNNKNKDIIDDQYDSDNSVDTVIAVSPAKKSANTINHVETLQQKSPVKIIKKAFDFLDSDDDSFLDIPLSQRLGLTDVAQSKLEIDSKPLAKDNEDKLDFSWLDDNSVEASSPKKAPVPSSPTKTSPLKLDQSQPGKHKSPSKKPAKRFEKIEKRPYQSDTPPGKFYTSLKEKNTKKDSTLVEPDDENLYKIEETITPARTRLTPEKLQRLKDEKERRKAERIEEKKVREKMKAKEKEKKAALREVGKVKLISDCHKFCKTYVDICLVERHKISDELQALFREKEAQLILETVNPIDCGIRWMRELREMIEEENEDETNVNLVRKEVEADIILKVLQPLEYIPLIHSSICKIEPDPSDDDESDDVNNINGQTMFEYVTSILDIYDKNLTLILFGYDKYWNQQKNRENAEYRARMGMAAKKRTKKDKESIPLIKKCDLDLVLFDLQVKLTESSFYSSKRVHIVQSETSSDLCNIIWSHTKATAMCSIKKSQREQQGLDWYAQNDGFGSVDIQKDADITSLWTRQLMTFTKMSEEMAKAISEIHPCPQSLLAAYRQCSTQEEMETLLSGIGVTRKNYTTGFTTKNLGPQVSRRIYQFMTTRNGELIIE